MKKTKSKGENNVYTGVTLLSTNKKTKTSLNLPIAGHCTPTKTCAFCCYGRMGHTRRPSAIRKAAYVSEYLSGNDLTRLTSECRQLTSVRLSGVGDLLESHIPQSGTKKPAPTAGRCWNW